MGANISLFTLLQVNFYRVSFDNILISVNKMTSFFLLIGPYFTYCEEKTYMFTHMKRVTVDMNSRCTVDLWMQNTDIRLDFT